MCLFTRYMINKRYVPTKKNGYNPPDLEDERMKYIPIKCGQCIECRKSIAENWRIRLIEEIKKDKKGRFITLTFKEEELEKLEKELETTDANKIATVAIRRFRWNWRKQKDVQ